MFSGGLDSVIAVHLLRQQGFDVTALHFVLPFESGLGLAHTSVRKYAEVLDVPLQIEEEGDEFLGMINDPHFGYGKNANPCVDCRIHRLEKAKKIMDESGASFLATGEVIGQRPMSQRRDSLFIIEKKAGLKGLLLRPLSAQLLEPTIPEMEGLVDRSKLLSIAGRGRKDQLAYAKKYGLEHATPAGGCVLTHKEVSQRYLHLKENYKTMTLNDFKLLAYGRHFKIGPLSRLVVGRDKDENEILEKLVTHDDHVFVMADILGPFCIGRGNFSDNEILKAASLTARYSKDRNKEVANVRISNNDSQRILEIKPADDTLCDSLRI